MLYLQIEIDQEMGIVNSFPKEQIKELKRLLSESQKIVVTCHIRPDGDAVGSSLGWYHILKSFGKDVTVVLPDRMPKSLNFLPGSREVAVYTQHEEWIHRLLRDADLVIMCDFNTPSRQGNLGEVVMASKARKVLVDHHKEPDIDCDLMFSYLEMSSASELSFRLMAALGWYIDMNLDCCTALLTGIVTDTQNFTVNCDNPETYEIMLKLLEKGVDKSRIIREAVRSTTYSAMKLNCYAISERLEIFENHHAALITLNESELKRFNYEKGDTEGLVNEPLRIRGIIYSVFMREDADCIKISMRSIERFPVDRICREHYGGGGHLMAAGGEFYGTLDEAKNILLNCMGDYDRFLPDNISKEDLK